MPSSDFFGVCGSQLLRGIALLLALVTVVCVVVYARNYDSMFPLGTPSRELHKPDYVLRIVSGLGALIVTLGRARDFG
jgi:hypothetical protein